MDWRARIQAEDVTPAAFFEEILPELHAERGADEFDQFSEVPILVSFVLEGEGGGRWSVAFQPGELEIERGELWDDPLLTLSSQMRDWPITRARLAGWVDKLEEAFERGGEFFVKAQDLKALQRFEGTITMTATGYEEGGQTRDLQSKVFLNSYEARTSDGFQVIISASDYQRVVEGALTPAKAFADGQIRLEGNVSLAMQLASALMRLRRR
jgi:putative sterol carrier protein